RGRKKGATLARATQAVKREEKAAALKARAEANGHAEPDGDAWRVAEGHCLDWLHPATGGRPRLIFADPPYNVGVNYGDGEAADRLPDAEYLDGVRGWMKAAANVLAGDGSLWVLISDEYVVPYRLLLAEAGLHLRQSLIWYETFGVNCADKFNRCHRHLLWAVKDKRKFVFNREAVTRPSDRQTKYKDKRAAEGGKNWDSVWGVPWDDEGHGAIPRLTDTCGERLPDFPTQLPLALLNPIVGVASDPGDLVLDPFSGSATTGEAALRLGRRFVGVEL